MQRCLDALEDDPHADLETLLGSEPEWSCGVREQLALLDRVGLLQSQEDVDRAPRQLGEFRILRQLGRGGMGVVYLAVQESLGREVALKLVHPEHLYFPLARDRFRREVRAAARLRHPGIVPVHTFGEADGVPFYAMERVPGASLAEVLDQLRGRAPRELSAPLLRDALERALDAKGDRETVAESDRFRGSWIAACCEIVRDVALALEHAHQNDVLHRDLKPSNLLLATDGRVLLIDFGLALADGDPRLTRSGSTIGSLPYLAPEQLRASAPVDRRTDVHALGVTLYELLTLAPPFGDGSPGTRERILAGRVDAPSRGNPQVPADVDAICLAAIDPDPARRYPSAAAFADDLQRFLEHRPVLARPPSPWLRFTRLVRRRPATAIAVVSAVLLLVAVPTVFAVQARLAAGELRAALDEANRERERAALHLGEALEAFDTMLSRTASARLANVPRTAHLRRQLLEDALAFHLRLAAREPGDERVRLATIGAWRRVGEIRTELGELTEALDVIGQAERALDAMEPLARSSREARSERAHLLTTRARVVGRIGRADERLAALREACDVLAGLLAETPSDARLRVDSARTRIDLAVYTARAGAIDDARALSDGALADLATWLGEPAEASMHAKLLGLRATALDSLAMIAVSAGRKTEADRWLREAAAVAEQVLADDPRDGDVLQRLAGVRLRRAMLMQELRDLDGASVAFDEAVELFERLVRDEPEDTDWTSQLGLLLSTRAEVHTAQGALDIARADHRRALELLDLVVAQRPQDRELRSRRAIAHGQFAGFLAASGDLAGQRGQLALAIADQRALVDAVPDDGPVVGNLVVSLAMAAQAAADDGDLDAAQRDIAEAVRVARASTRGGVGTSVLIDVLRIAADIAGRRSDDAGAVAALDEADRIATMWLAELPDDAERLTALGSVRGDRALHFANRDDIATARALLIDALSLTQRAADQGSAAATRQCAALQKSLAELPR
ncbi:MAG: protein kinase [Planctomycetes bacterium]|nr:protein kinase [Planctomycetota bacterium]